MYVDNVQVRLQESQVTALKPEGTRDPVSGMGCVLAGGTGDLALNPSFSGPQFPMGKMARGPCWLWPQQPESLSVGQASGLGGGWVTVMPGKVSGQGSLPQLSAGLQ